MESGYDPPDKSDKMEVSVENPSITPLGENGVRINFDASGTQYDSDSSQPPSSKRVKSSAAPISAAAKKTAAPEPMSSQVNDNIVPVIDHLTGNCSVCLLKVIPNETVRCYDCKKYFHGACKTIDKQKVRGEPIMPAQTYIKNWNEHIMKNNGGDFIGGRFFWVCASCITLKELGSPRNALDRHSMLEAVLIKSNHQHNAAFTQISETLSALTTTLEKIRSDNIPSVSCDGVSSGDGSSLQNDVPGRQSSSSPISKRTYSCVTGSSSLSSAKSSSSCTSNTVFAQVAQAPINQHNVTSSPKSDNFLYRLRLLSKENDGNIMNILKKLDNEGKLSSYDNYRSKGKSAIDLLFSDGITVDEEYNKLSDFFSNYIDHDVEVSKPEMIICKRTFLVGMSKGLTAKDVLTKVAHRYPELELTGKNKWNINILEPKPCLKRNTLYRSTVLLSPDLYDYISGNLNNRLRMGNYDSWAVYPCLSRCIKCQSLEHSFEQCKKREPCCAICSGNHYTKRCTVGDDPSKFCCINCKKSDAHKGNCNHRADSSDCPIYLQMRNTKN